MYKYLFIFGLFFSSLACAQSTYTAEQVEKSTDPQVIANFIKFNPTHPRTPEFKRKLLAVINNDKSIEGKIKVVFIEDYRVSNAEIIFAATDVSEQI